MTKYVAIALAALMMAPGSAPLLLSQTNPKIVTGKAAAKLFIYRGKPIHPFCVGFPLEASSRNTPNILDDCTSSKVAPRSEANGWWTAEYPEEKDSFHVSFPPYNSYGVLAKKGDTFLVASESSGGGTGQFSNLFWVRFDGKQIVLVKGEAGGDRCAGRVSGYRVDGSALRYNQATTTSDIIGLTGVKVDDKVTDRLRSGYLNCDGEAHYRYNLASEKMELTGLSLSGTDPANDADPANRNDPQVCYDKLVQQYAKAGKTNLKPAELKEFGQKFNATCSISARP